MNREIDCAEEHYRRGDDFKREIVIEEHVLRLRGETSRVPSSYEDADGIEYRLGRFKPTHDTGDGEGACTQNEVNDADEPDETRRLNDIGHYLLISRLPRIYSQSAGGSP